MSEYPTHGQRAMRGTITRRLLINALAEPDEAARYLPPGLRPHVIDGGTVVGCCLLDLRAVRPVPLPAAFGTRLRAAAHRISAEWDDEAGVTNVGVYVPVRHTSSRAAIALGGRWFPGVHRTAKIGFTEVGRCHTWCVDPADQASEYAVKVRATITSTSSSGSEPIGATCLSAAIGLSLDHRGTLEAARMEPDHRRALQVEIEGFDSAFLTRFSTIAPATSYLMSDVDVTWTRTRAPRSNLAEAHA